MTALADSQFEAHRLHVGDRSITEPQHNTLSNVMAADPDDLCDEALELLGDAQEALKKGDLERAKSCLDQAKTCSFAAAAASACSLIHAIVQASWLLPHPDETNTNAEGDTASSPSSSSIILA